MINNKYSYLKNMYETFDSLFKIQIANGEIMDMIKNYDNKEWYTNECEKIIDSYVEITFLVPYDIHKNDINIGVIRYIMTNTFKAIEEYTDDVTYCCVFTDPVLKQKITFKKLYAGETQYRYLTAYIKKQLRENVSNQTLQKIKEIINNIQL